MIKTKLGGNDGWLVPDDQNPTLFVTYLSKYERVRIQRVFKKDGKVTFQHQKLRDFELKKGRYQVGLTFPFDDLVDLGSVFRVINDLFGDKRLSTLSEPDKLEKDIKKYF